MLCLELGRLAAEPVKMQRNEQLQRLASKVAASWTARASALDARDVFAEFVELRPALAENVDEGLRREVRNGEAAIRDYLTTLWSRGPGSFRGARARLDAADSSIAVAPADVAPADATRSAWLARRLAERDKLRAACDAAEARVAELKAGTSN